MVDDRGMGNCGFSDQLRFCARLSLAEQTRQAAPLWRHPASGIKKVLSVPNDTTKAYAEVTANNPDRGAIGVLGEKCSHDIYEESKELK